MRRNLPTLPHPDPNFPDKPHAEYKQRRSQKPQRHRYPEVSPQTEHYFNSGKCARPAPSPPVILQGYHSKLVMAASCVRISIYKSYRPTILAAALDTKNCGKVQSEITAPEDSRAREHVSAVPLIL